VHRRLDANLPLRGRTVRPQQRGFAGRARRTCQRTGREIREAKSIGSGEVDLADHRLVIEVELDHRREVVEFGVALQALLDFVAAGDLHFQELQRAQHLARIVFERRVATSGQWSLSTSAAPLRRFLPTFNAGRLFSASSVLARHGTASG